jgi:hypothetical protein
MNTRDLIASIEWQLTSCPTCGRDNYTSLPWMDINQVRLLVGEAKRLLEMVEKYESGTRGEE